MKKIILLSFAISFFLLLLPTVMAENLEWEFEKIMKKLLFVSQIAFDKSNLGYIEKVCIDANTLLIKTERSVQLNGETININVTEKVNCPYGCENNECKEGSILNLITFPFALMVSFFLMFYRRDPIVNIIGSMILLVCALFLAWQGIFIGQLVKNELTFLIAFSLIGVSIYKLFRAGFRIRHEKEI